MESAPFYSRSRRVFAWILFRLFYFGERRGAFFSAAFIRNARPPFLVNIVKITVGEADNGASSRNPNNDQPKRAHAKRRDVNGTIGRLLY